MEKLYDSGKARAIGVINFFCKKLVGRLTFVRVPPAVNQVECHPVWRQHMLHKLCQLKGIHLSAYAPLGSPGSPRNDGPNFLSHSIIIFCCREVAENFCSSCCLLGHPDGPERIYKEQQRSMDKGKH